MLNPIWLNTFVVLVQTGHFTRTAEKLFMTQPGVSQHINKLESACGFPLIAREKKGFDLTEQGRLVFDYARQLEKNESELIEKLSFDDPYSGVCSISCSGALALTLYPKLLDWQVKHPLLVVSLKAAPQNRILSDIREGIVDVGIVTELPNTALFDVKEIGHEELCLVFSRSVDVDMDIYKVITGMGFIGHPDAEHYLPLYFAQCGEPSLRKLAIEGLPQAGFVNQIGQILQPVAKGLGFTVMPLTAVKSFHSPDLLTVFKPKTPVIEPLFQIQKKNRILPARYKMLNEIIQNILGIS
ncbi:LysR family transcriptional regulator [Marinomonas sp. C2222]|uniref:LysR family transcriptional regulator n=1 Tax=Marinomonas sargassi TaxID=2984494 RepID=A0ABT2YSJ1_9GAMM|nr:LysR family transcriptional regulator [Marinomonas sargassi]MCV2402863.1 LysR family transcriptional regulator [Marinomonas sargassi]